LFADKISEAFAMSEWSKKLQIMRRYDLTAHLYDMRYAEEQKAKFKAALEELNVSMYGFVLDAGCGTGLLFDHIANKSEAIVGIDISRRILNQAKNRARKFSHADLVLADVDNMPLKNNIFDHAFSFTVIQNVPEAVKTLREIKRVAKQDAIIVITGLKKAFCKEDFIESLVNVDLNIIALKDEGLQCYVALCKKKR